MPTTLQEVQRRLNQDEPSYPQLAMELGADALPHLATLANGRDPMLASKAAYLAGVIGGAGAVPVIEAAARRPEPAVRAGAAAAVRNLDAKLAEGVATRLLADPDVGVRKVTVQSVGRLRSPAIDERLRAIQRADPEPMLREQAGRVLLQR